MTNEDALELIYHALKTSRNVRIDDVDLDGEAGQLELVLTTTDGKVKQTWVLRGEDLSEMENVG